MKIKPEAREHLPFPVDSASLQQALLATLNRQ